MLILLRLFFACLTAIGYKPMIYNDFTISSQQSDDLISEVEIKSRKNAVSFSNFIGYTSSDLLSRDFSYYFYDYIKDFESPRTSNLSYNSPYSSSIDYTFTDDTNGIGVLKKGGFGNNLLNYPNSVTLNGYGFVISANSISNQIFDSGTYTFSVKTNTSATLEIKICDSAGTDLNTYYFSVSNGMAKITFTTNTSWYIGYLYSGTGTFSEFQLNYGSEALSYQPFLNGIIEYGGINAYRFNLKKEIQTISNYGVTCYKYVLSFYGRTPNDYPFLFSITSYVMNPIKWVDQQGNLYNASFYNYSSIFINPSLNISINGLVYCETDTGSRPITTCFYDKYVEAKDSEAFNTGYDSGYNLGYNEGRSNGYQSGYTDGYTNANNQDDTALTIFTGILEVGLLPVNVFLRFFDYEVFGINIAGLISGIVTVALIMILIRFIFGGKENG